jgi:Arc/MetJ family transcription regulator
MRHSARLRALLINFDKLTCSAIAGHRTLTPIFWKMGTHMKTTIEISELLLKEAKKAAARDGTTLRTLVEHGLRHELKQRQSPLSFRLRKASFKGEGLQTAAKGLTWDQIRELAYSGRGS